MAKHKFPKTAERRMRVLLFKKKRNGNWLLVSEQGIFDVEFCLNNPELVIVQDKRAVGFEKGYTLVVFGTSADEHWNS